MISQENIKQNNNYNTQTHNKKEQFNECLISFKDMPFNTHIHYSSCPHFQHNQLSLTVQKQHYPNQTKYSEAEIHFDHLINDEVRIYDEDGLITNFRLDQSDLSFEDIPVTKFRRGITISGNKPITNIDKYKKSPSTNGNKQASSRSLDSSPFKSTTKTQNENKKIKNIGRFINKPLRYTGNNELKSNYMGCCLRKSLPKKKASHGRNCSLEHFGSPSISYTQEIIRIGTNDFNRNSKRFRKSVDMKSKNNKKNFFKFSNNNLYNNKNHEKILNELFSVFGKKLNNVEPIYHKLSEDDKKSLIYNLLGMVYSLKTDIQQQRKENENMKKEAELKSKLISALAKEIEKTKKQIELNKTSTKGNTFHNKQSLYNKNEKEKISYLNKHNKSSSTAKKGNKSIEKTKRK